MYRRVVINFKHDEHKAVEGVLYAQRGDWLVLKRAKLLVEGRKPVEVDGDFLVECSNVAFLQAL